MNLINKFGKEISEHLQQAKILFFIFKKQIHHKIQDFKDNFYDTRSFNLKIPEFHSYIKLSDLDTSSLDKKLARFLIEKYLNHQFDLLGTGWCEFSYRNEPLNIMKKNYSSKIYHDKEIISKLFLFDLQPKVCIPYSKLLWKMILKKNKNYNPIDWLRDIKSGYRWENQRYNSYINELEGVDIKVPWELARFYHLPQLAILSTLFERDFKNKIILEFRNQVLDFILQNPPRATINWACTMDVAIRAVNLLISYDLFKQIDKGEILDKNFNQIILNSLHDHAIHIIDNLEWHKSFSGNHYLSDIVGLLYICAYIPQIKNSNTYLAFSIQEIINSMKEQFYSDGVSFESSSSYHFLSTQLITYAVAIIFGLKDKQINNLRKYKSFHWRKYPRLKPKYKQIFIIENKIIFPKWFIIQLFKAYYFSINIRKQNGKIPQIGDNDSGYLLKISPTGTFLSSKEISQYYSHYNKILQNMKKGERYFDENILDKDGIISSISQLFRENDKISSISTIPLEKSLISSISNKIKFSKIQNLDHILQKFKRDDNKFPLNNDPLQYIQTTEIILKRKNQNLLKDLENYIFIEGGLYIFRGEHLFLLLSSTPVGLNGYGGHTHNDKLSIELQIDSKDIFVDPGSFIYTPSPALRNKFRSIKAHNTIIIDDLEQNRWVSGKEGIFSIQNESRCCVNFIHTNSISITLKYRDIVHTREIHIKGNSINIIDSCNKQFRFNINSELYSNGYGKRVKELDFRNNQKSIIEIKFSKNF